tara:strand:- start:967 stop:1479 length:513 start_codon:yes stop_codon:yes gene_type:complete
MEQLNEIMSTYKDFPKEGIEFKDVMEISKYPKVFRRVIEKMASSEIIKESEAIVSIDARGFIFGSAISFYASKPMVLARKPGKLPGQLISKKYSLEYGENFLSIQKESLRNFRSYSIVDDLLATGGTARCVSDIIKANGNEVKGLVVVVELEKMLGRNTFGLPVKSILKC